jgi:hypothetical protein
MVSPGCWRAVIHSFLRPVGRLADGQQGVGMTVGCRAQGLGAHPGMLQRRGDQLLVLAQAVGREIGHVDDIGLGPVTDDELLAVELGVGAEPVLQVAADHRLVVLEAVRVGHFPGVLDHHGAVDITRIAQLEEKPLHVLAAGIGAYLQANVVGRVGLHDLDIAAVEMIERIFEWSGRILIVSFCAI